MPNLTSALTYEDLELRHRVIHQIHVCLQRYQRLRRWIPPGTYRDFNNGMIHYYNAIDEIQTHERLQMLAPVITDIVNNIDRVLQFHIRRRMAKNLRVRVN